MAEIYNGRYALADPSSGLTALSMEGGELNMFGSCTKIKTTQRDSFPIIQDEPTMLKVEKYIKEQLPTGLAVEIALAGVAVAVEVTGETADPLASVLGGVAIGTVVSASQTGYGKNCEEYWERLTAGGIAGYIADASVYGLIAAVPAAATIAEAHANMILETSNFTRTIVSSIMTIEGYMLATAQGGYKTYDIYVDNSVYNWILDKLFNNHVDVYETAGMALDMFVEAYTNFGSNQALENRKKNSDEKNGKTPSKKTVNINNNENIMDDDWYEEGMVFERLNNYRDEDEDEDKEEEKEYRIFGEERHIFRCIPSIGKEKEIESNSVQLIQDLDSAGGGIKFTTKSEDGWYSDIAVSTASGRATREIFVSSTNNTDKEKYPDIYVYDGLPWEPDNNTYFFDLKQAREDVWPLYEEAEVSQRDISSMLMSSDVQPSPEVTYEGKYATVIDGISALGVGVWPTMWKNYYSEYAMEKIAMDGISANWTYKIAIVVVDKGEDTRDSSKWKYVPATRISAKAHTFYGGVLQTNVTLGKLEDNKIKEGDDIILTTSNSGHTENIVVANVNEYKNNNDEYESDEDAIIEMLKAIKGVRDILGDWWVHYVEVYNIGKENMKKINRNYDFAGYIIYGDTFK